MIWAYLRVVSGGDEETFKLGARGRTELRLRYHFITWHKALIRSNLLPKRKAAMIRLCRRHWQFNLNSSPLLGTFASGRNHSRD